MKWISRSLKFEYTMKHLILTNTTFNTLITAFSDNLKAKGYSKGSQQMLPACVQEFLYRMEEQLIYDLKGITAQNIQEHYQYLCNRPNDRRDGGLSPSMLGHHVYSIRTFFAWLEQIEGIEVNPFTGLDFPRPYSPPRKPLSKDQIKKLYEACENDRDRALLGVFYACGLRRSEGQDLNTVDISYSEAKLIVKEGKFKKRREIPLHPKVLEHFRIYQMHFWQPLVRMNSNDRYAFLLNNEGTRMSGTTANNRIKYLAKKVAIVDASLHHLRHSVATHLRENGMKLEQIMEYLGHSSLDVTQGYLEGYRINWQWQQKHQRKLQYRSNI